VTALAELLVAVDDPAAWHRLGLVFEDDTTRVGQVAVRVVSGSGGVVSWGLSGAPEAIDGIDAIDGLAVHRVEPAADRAATAHPLGAVRVDHAVVFTDSLERTCGALAEATGCELKRVREAGAVRQGFHRLGEVIAEVVESDRATHASYWGFVLEVADLDAACSLLGPDLVGEPRGAVQPGQRIATIRSAAGLGVPVALISGRPTS